jgi:DinB superfamily
MPINNRARLIETLEQTQAKLAEATSTLTEAELDFRSGTDEWSIREILAHLVDDEMFVMRTRLERIMKEEEPALASHDEKKWYNHRNTSRDKVAELLSDFALQRTASLGIIKLLREEEWARTAYHPEYGTFTAEEWLGDWVEHDIVHIKQIEKTLELYKEAH